MYLLVALTNLLVLGRLVVELLIIVTHVAHDCIGSSLRVCADNCPAAVYLIQMSQVISCKWTGLTVN